MQFEIGISTMRYFPASGTAGLARSLVSGNNRVPCPPPIITESTLLVLIDCRPVCDITKKSFHARFLTESYTPVAQPARRTFQPPTKKCPRNAKRRKAFSHPLRLWIDKIQFD